MSGENKSKPDLDEDFEADERLFHYTSSQGLYGILQSGNLWATHFQFLNDSQEFYSAKSSLSQSLQKKIHAVFARIRVNEGRSYKEGIDVRALSAEGADRVIDALYDAILGTKNKPEIGNDAFVFSTFCCRPTSEKEFQDGTLLHWATYGRNGGYALQLNPHKIFSLIKLEGKKFPNAAMVSAKASYAAPGDVPASLKNEYDVIGQYAQKLVEAELNKQDLASVDGSNTGMPFIRAITLLKDEYFSHEREARIGVFRPRKKNKRRKSLQCRCTAVGEYGNSLFTAVRRFFAWRKLSNRKNYCWPSQR